jgi:flagellar basal body-associated protein FliL
MAISLNTNGDKSKEETRFSGSLMWAIVLALLFGSISYFLFFNKSSAETTPAVQNEKEVLSKEELSKVQAVLKNLEKSPFKDLKQFASKSTFSAPSRSRVGTTANPFTAPK